MRTALVEMTRHEGARIAIVTEEPICECQDVLVSTSRFSLYGRSYPLADVKNVRIGSPMPQWRLAVACAGISTVLAVSSLLLINIGYATVAFAFAVLALVLRPAKARQLHIEVGAEQLTKARILAAAAIEVGAECNNHDRAPIGIEHHADERVEEHRSFLGVLAGGEDFFELIDHKRDALARLQACNGLGNVRRAKHAFELRNWVLARPQDQQTPTVASGQYTSRER